MSGKKSGKVTKKVHLWERLAEYNFENLVPTHLSDKVSEFFGGTDASLHAFAAKVAKKHNWTVNFTLRVIAEYKKFIYIAMVGDNHVTPSKVIDQVWHEHMLFTKAYREFCDDVLGQPFDHFPELMPEEDQTGMFNAQYVYAMNIYRGEFNAEPPADIWGLPKFDQERVKQESYEPRVKKTRREDSSTVDYGGEAPLHLHFDNTTNFDGFGGGKSGGAGATGSYSHSHSDSGSYSSHGDSGHSDSGGHSGGDAGGGDSGGGSSCGGGGCSGGCGS